MNRDVFIGITVPERLEVFNTAREVLTLYYLGSVQYRLFLFYSTLLAFCFEKHFQRNL